VTAAERECGTKPTANQPLSQSELAAIAARIAAEAAGKIDIASVWPGHKKRCGTAIRRRPGRRS
jgi:hypothetical protein